MLSVVAAGLWNLFLLETHLESIVRFYLFLQAFGKLEALQHTGIPPAVWVFSVLFF